MTQQQEGASVVAGARARARRVPRDGGGDDGGDDSDFDRSISSSWRSETGLKWMTGRLTMTSLSCAARVGSGRVESRRRGVARTNRLLLLSSCLPPSPQPPAPPRPRASRHRCTRPQAFSLASASSSQHTSPLEHPSTQQQQDEPDQQNTSVRDTGSKRARERTREQQQAAESAGAQTPHTRRDFTMGLTISKLLSKLIAKKEMRILMVRSCRARPAAGRLTALAFVLQGRWGGGAKPNRPSLALRRGRPRSPACTRPPIARTLPTPHRSDSTPPARRRSSTSSSWAVSLLLGFSMRGGGEGGGLPTDRPTDRRRPCCPSLLLLPLLLLLLAPDTDRRSQPPPSTHTHTHTHTRARAQRS